MNKLQVLLSETSILNFKILKKLVKAYRLQVTTLTIISVFAGLYFAQQQRLLYIVETNFEIKGKLKDAGSTEIVNLLRNAVTEEQPLNEIMIMVTSSDFLDKVTAYLMDSTSPESLYFFPKESQNEEVWKIARDCNNNQKCLVENLRGIVVRGYSIKHDELFGQRFTLKVKSYSADTSRALLNAVKKATLDIRIETLLQNVTFQEKALRNMKIEREKSSQFDLYQGYRNKLEKLRVFLSGKTQEIFTLEKQIQIKKIKEHENISELETMKGVADKGLSNFSVKNEGETNKLIDKIKQVKADLGFFNSRVDLRPEEVLVRNQLKQELVSLNKKLAKLDTSNFTDNGKIDRVVAASKKITRARERSGAHKIQIRKMENDKSRLLKEVKEVETEMAFINSELEKMKPHMEYTKQIEERLIALNLVKNTITNDLKFSNVKPQIYPYKRVSKVQIVLFTILMGGALILFSIVIRYLFDRKIRDSSEIEKLFPGVKVIGQVPSFNK